MTINEYLNNGQQSKNSIQLTYKFRWKFHKKLWYEFYKIESDHMNYWVKHQKIEDREMERRGGYAFRKRMIS